jgi:hypothetical protein
MEVRMQLSPGQPPVIFDIFAKEKWNDTGLNVHAGEVYELSAIGIWHDASIPSGPEGYESSKLVLRLFAPFRRRPKDLWFALIGAVGQREETAFLIGKGCEWVVKEDGILNCYANDVSGFYFNNSGEVTLTVLRKS